MISVIMCVYNTQEKYLRESIESIINQTFSNYEFIIVDDGSDLMTKQILSYYDDKRIKIIVNKANCGLTKSLNLALKIAVGKYIARMDADDFSYPDRLNLQYKFMEKNANIGVVGCWTSNNVDNKICHWHGMVSSEWRKVAMLFANCGVCHSTAFIRKSILEKHNIEYNEEIIKAQDYDMWIRLLEVTRMAVLPKTLLMYRKHGAQISVANNIDQNYYRDCIKKKEFYRVFPNCSDDQMKQLLNTNKAILTTSDIQKLWGSVFYMNHCKGIYSSKLLLFELKRIWFENIIPTFFKEGQYSILWCGYTRKFMGLNYFFWRIKLFIEMHTCIYLG